MGFETSNIFYTIHVNIFSIFLKIDHNIVDSRGISTGISVYRGKTGIVEYVTAGMVSGVLYKLNMGPRGWLVGGGVGKITIINKKNFYC